MRRRPGGHWDIIKYLSGSKNGQAPREAGRWTSSLLRTLHINAREQS